MASSARIEELKKKFDENPRRYFAPLANEFRKMGDFDQAILICQEFLPQQPGHMSGHIVYGQALFEARRLEESRTVFETALGLDPENLIALRHLGDISREGGDIEAARGWYRRVLDADPRNEEIASLLAALDEPASIPWTTPTPRSVNLVTDPTGPASAAADPVVELPLETAPTESPLKDFQAMLDQAAHDRDAAPPAAPADSELLDLDAAEFNIGTPAPAQDALGVERSVDTPFGFESGTFEQPSSAIPSLEGLEPTEHSEPSSGARSLPRLDAEPARERESAPEPRASGAHSELPTFDTFDMPSDAPASAEPARAAQDEIIADDLPVASPVPHAAPASGTGGFVTETMAELYVQQGHIEEAVVVYRQLVGRYPGDEVLRARLADLEATLAAAPPPAVEAPAAPASAPASLDEFGLDAAFAPSVGEGGSGDTIRDFLSALAQQRPGGTRGSNDGGGTPDEEPQEGAHASAYESASHDAEDTAGAEAQTEEYAEPAYDAYADAGEAGTEVPVDVDSYEGHADVAAPSHDFDAAADEHTSDVGDADNGTADHGAAERRATVGGSIDALFSDAEASGADQQAASLLAGAFSGSAADAPEIVGKPTRRAQDELSLDHVFRDRPASGDRAQANFSFDQFFAQGATDRGGAAGEPSTSPSGENDDDIQQFNAWLEGLKKT